MSLFLSKQLEVLWYQEKLYLSNYVTKDLKNAIGVDTSTSPKKFDVATILMFDEFWDFLMFHQIFFSPQVKRCTIITYKYGM